MRTGGKEPGLLVRLHQRGLERDKKTATDDKPQDHTPFPRQVKIKSKPIFQNIKHSIHGSINYSPRRAPQGGALRARDQTPTCRPPLATSRHPRHPPLTQIWPPRPRHKLLMVLLRGVEEGTTGERLRGEAHAPAKPALCSLVGRPGAGPAPRDANRGTSQDLAVHGCNGAFGRGAEHELDKAATLALRDFDVE